jgi:hypothetical protein
MDEKLQFPGLANTWTMRVENRLDMKLTRIKTPLGLKVQGTNVDGIQQLTSQIQDALSEMPQVRSVFSQKGRAGFLCQRRRQSGISGSPWRS